MWLFKHKFHADGTLSRYKARLVANDSSQQLSVDFDETFNPVAKPTNVRTVLSLVVSHKWPIYQLDVKNAFLNKILVWTKTSTSCLVSAVYSFFYSNALAPYRLFTMSVFISAEHTLSRSSAEAEYRGVANVVAETAYLGNPLRELHSPLSTATLVYCDNVSAIYMSANRVQHQQTKHIEIDIHFVRDMVTAGQVRVLHVPSRYQFADVFTKGLPFTVFEEFRSSLSVRPPSAPTVMAY
ncbi:ribonuclease H-like domain-containing protein [Tanacetum coccineum]